MLNYHAFAELRRLYQRGCRAVALLLWLAFLIAISPSVSQAQNCDQLTPNPSGDDWGNIQTCLNTAGHATLQPGNFHISQSLKFPAPNVSLIGAGRTQTFVATTFSCTAGEAIIDVNGQQIDVSNGVVRDFFLDLTSISGTCSIPAVRFIRTSGGQVANMVITGTGSASSGGSLIGGVVLIKSSNILVSNNKIRDFGGSNSSGVQVEDSPSAIVDGNRTTNVDFGIIVRNNGGASGGGAFDSSNTRVTNNIMTSVRGRAMKVAAAQVDSLPLRNLVITGNSATDFGKTGLYLTTGVQNSTIESNSFVGAATSFYGLWVGSFEIGGGTNLGINPSYNNQINFNTFRGGSAGGYDVSFNGNPNAAGPDQPTISRGSWGNNSPGPRGIDPTHNQCFQYSHAWKSYLNGLNYVPVGGKILLAAAGTAPGSRVTYHIRVPGNPFDAMTFTTMGTTTGGCVLNQEQSPAINLAPGLYDIFVDLLDGNARYPDPNTGSPVPINGWKLSVQLDVR